LLLAEVDDINPATIHTLATGDWIRRGEPLCLIGGSGTGKSHLLIGLGTAAAEKGYRVKYTLATRLVNELVEAVDRLTFHGTIIETGTDSYRLAHTKQEAPG
jgi:DNA replication protein DnaC